MKKYIFLIFVLCTSAFVYGQTGNRHFENNGNFSICPPNGWNIIEIPGLKYKIFHGNAVNGFSPNIIIVDEIYSGTLNNYVELNNQNIRLMFPDNELILNETFRTNNEIIGIKQVFISANSGQLLKQYFYYFSNGDRKIVITCSVPNSVSQNYERIFDESVKTFEFIRR